MFILVLVIHVLVALFLITVILLQGGRGGLGEALGGAAAQSLFGGAANTVMTRLTTGCAALFMITCMSLAMLSTARGRSVIERLPALPTQVPLPKVPATTRKASVSPSASTPPIPRMPVETPPAPSPAPSTAAPSTTQDGSQPSATTTSPATP